jgi:hypothetical protein
MTAVLLVIGAISGVLIVPPVAAKAGAPLFVARAMGIAVAMVLCYPLVITRPNPKSFVAWVIAIVGTVAIAFGLYRAICD